LTCDLGPVARDNGPPIPRELSSTKRRASFASEIAADGQRALSVAIAAG
jgi:hypothetical protein